MDLLPRRKIGERDFGLPGPLLIAIGQLHGNEPAGTEAIKQVFHLLDLEWEKNLEFRFSGRMVGLRGNLQAISLGLRYVEEDLNRIWEPQRLARIGELGEAELGPEEKECRQLNKAIIQEVNRYPAESLVLMDLHTTTATGGIFTIPTGHAQAQKIARFLHAPVVHGLIETLQGTLASYALKNPWEVPSSGIVFEAGQHHAPSSIDHAVSALVSTLWALGMVDGQDVEHIHEERLKEWSESLPEETQLLYRHKVTGEDHFHMLPGFQNFMPVRKGQLLATDKGGPIHAPYSGYILMPLYQSQGEDGFFILGEL